MGIQKQQKKNVRQRAGTTHGWGAMKKHRGAGNRGGRGNAGSGKRADQKKPSYWKDTKYFGKHGFKSKNFVTKIGIPIAALEDSLRTLIAKGKAKQENEVIVIDLDKLGYNKLLANGKATKKLKILTPYASEKAVEKIKAAGGSVEGLVGE